MPYTDDEVLIGELMQKVLIGELMQKASELERKLSIDTEELEKFRSHARVVSIELATTSSERDSLKAKLSVCMSQRDRALSMLRVVMNELDNAYEYQCEGYDAAVKLLDESRDWK